MATQTTNYGLIKPDYSDPVDVDVLNDNADLIDAALTDKANLVNGKVPASELPSYVDDVIEGYYYNGAFYEDSAHTTPITGETGKIYVDLTTDESYRWSGSAYVLIATPDPPVTDVQNEAGQSLVHNGVAVIPSAPQNSVVIDIFDGESGNMYTTAPTTAGDIKNLIESGKSVVFRYYDITNEAYCFLFPAFVQVSEDYGYNLGLYGDLANVGSFDSFLFYADSEDDPFVI